MSKGLIAFIVVVCIGFTALLFVLLKRSHDEAQKKSDTLVEEFKRVNEDLKRSNARIDSVGKALIDSVEAKKDKIK